MLLIPLATAAFAGDETDPKQDRDAAREIFSLLNHAREREGLDWLKWNDQLEDAAFAHAKLVAKHRQLSHQYPGEPPLTMRLAKTNIRLDRSGENLALDSGPEAAHEALMQSPGHRANILSPHYNAVGIAAIKSGGTLYVVEDFAHKLPEESASEFGDRVAAEFEQVRLQSGAPRMSRINVSYLDKEACEMARKDSVDANISAPGARFVIAFTATEPQKLPADVNRLRSDRELVSYGIGACFARTQSYPNGVYWIVMALFPKGRGI